MFLFYTLPFFLWGLGWVFTQSGEAQVMVGRGGVEMVVSPMCDCHMVGKQEWRTALWTQPSGSDWSRFQLRSGGTITQHFQYAGENRLLVATAKNSERQTYRRKAPTEQKLVSGRQLERNGRTHQSPNCFPSVQRSNEMILTSYYFSRNNTFIKRNSIISKGRRVKTVEQNKAVSTTHLEYLGNWDQNWSEGRDSFLHLAHKTLHMSSCP